MIYTCEIEHYEEVSCDLQGNPRQIGEAGFDEAARFYFDVVVRYSEIRTYDECGGSIDRTLEEIEVTKVECLRWDKAGHELLQDVTQLGAPEYVEVEMKKRVINDFNDGLLEPSRVWDHE